MIIWIFTKMIQSFSAHCLLHSEPSPAFNHVFINSVLNTVYRVFLSCSSKFSRLLPKIQFQSCFYIFMCLQQQYPTLSTKICISYSPCNKLASVQFSRSVTSDSLRPHESQHARPSCPSPTPGVHPNSRPSSRWCHPAISSLSSPSPPAPNSSQHQGLF